MRRARRGTALVPVMVLMGALLFVAAAFTDAVVQGMRASRLGWQGERAAHEADAALLDAVAGWDRAQAAALVPGESDTLAHVVSGSARTGLVRTGVIRTRLSARQFAVEGWADVEDGAMRPARRVVGRTVRLAWPLPPIEAALTVLGALDLRDGAEVLGADAQPAGWDEDCRMDRRAWPLGAVATPVATVSAGAIVSGAGVAVRIMPSPEVLGAASAFDDAYMALAAAATARTADSVLDLAELHGAAPACPRWLADGRRGPSGVRECQRRWPVVQATHGGTVRLTGTLPVQGVMLVDGDLQLEDGVTVHGLMLVRGRVQMHATSSATAPQVTGALVVRDTRALGSVLATGRVQASQCAVRRALAGAGAPEPIGRHGWSERP